ncbi:PREDICTED: kinetochore-associated protein 1 [Cyphomyrmex costatus]|uniref:kinetochore-associated protein 1 n=1 Tax=Cyphomyrmex costatus TaxID=456900 RepID=UPI0008524567|nr:PREDICTED: kinetochore-associated protein 1 [Cyphomyrmex costatus]
MALWNSVQSGFNVDDETVNFGPRIITESNGSLHEACTVATIQSLEKVDQQPNVIASIQYSKICVAIDKSITVFNDETCDEILYNISFPSMIVSYCISKDEGIATNNETGIIDTFRIKTILKSIPEIRLAKLLKKRQFDAAEAFAEKFNLSMESIYYSKAALFVEQLSPWTKSTPNSVNVDTLINILNKIQNVQYVIECCNKALISDYIQMRRIYLYARERIMQNIKIKNIDDSLNTSLSIINDALYRLETFHMIQDTEADTLLNDDASMKEWIQFSQANLLEECTTRLNMGQLKSATLIWTRHLPDLVKHISIQTVQNIFTILPEDVDLSCLWLWLIHFIPTLLSLLPDAINEIMSWSLKKLKYLEIFHHTVWPEIGIEFAKKFMKLLKFEDNQLVYFHQEYRYQNSLLKQFMVLFQALTDIQQLKIVHRLKVPVDLYIDSPVEAIYMLLDKIHLDQISNFINTFLKQYIFNNNLQNDTVFCTYIQKTIKNSYSWWFNEEATWEKRVAIIISLIHNIEKRLEQTLIVLRKAPVPWSSTIATLAETGINYDHSLSFKIKIECDYVPTKLILKKYGYATIGRLISRIIKENYDSMINDIDVLTKDNQQLKQDAFCQCINARLNENFLFSNIKENDWSVMHKTIIKVAELLGLEKSYATLSMLEQMKNLTNLNELEHLIDDDDLCSNIMSKKFENILKICLLILQHSTVDTNVVKVEEMDQLLSNFLENTKKMQPQHNDYSLLQIFKTFYFMYYGTSIRNEERLTEMKCILSQLLINLLRKLCTGRSFDLQLGLSALFMLSEQEACDWLHTISASFQADHIRHCTISTLGYEYSRLGQNRSLIQTFENHKLLHIWAQRLSDYSINPKEVLMNSALNKKELLQQIISSNKENMISLLKDYCCSFGFNFNDCLLLYLQVLLKTWNPTLTISNINVNKELLICKEEVDELRKKCNAIVAQMQDISMLKQCMSTLWQHITFYHYEVFIILMDLIEDKDIEKRNYLCFLQNYTRSGPPTSMEHNEWIQLNPGHSTLPAIAQWRLPFLLKVDIWKIITPELNLKTYDKWLDIAPVLNLEAHLICSLAIKGEMEKVWANNSITSKNTTWSLYSKNTTLLKDSKKCIQQLTDSDGFYYGTAALYYIVNYTPPGADRVAAAKECYEYAQLAAQNSTKFKEGKELEVRLEKDEYLALIEYPYKLVYALYNDKSIPLRYRTATKYKPDINAAVNELGKLFSLNTIKLRMDLLEEWLQSNAKYTELSQSFTETFIVSKESDQNTDCEDNLLRICYILEYGDMDLFAQFLINIGFGNRHGDTEYSYNVRYRVFQILQTVVDIPTLEKLTKQDICTFRKYMKSLQYIGKLESLGLCYSIDSFETCCKRELVQILWSSQRHVSYALSVIAQICIEFEINDILFWDDTLTQMRKLRMISDLKKVLLQLRDKNVIVNCNGYKTGWQLIISEPFSKMDINPNLEQIDNCIEAVCLLYSCPVTHELDFTAIVRDCFQSQQAHLAAALLPFLNDVENKFVLETINQKCQIEKLIEDLNHLSSRGVLTITHSLAMVQKSIP